MRVLGRVQQLGRQYIGRRRRSRSVQLLHRLAAFVESAYVNEGSDFAANGERTLLRKLAQQDFRNVVDVGANYGDWTAEALECWPNATVHAFEVAPITFSHLEQRFEAMHRTPRVRLNCLGLSEKAGKQAMFYFPEHPDLTCDLPRHDQHTRQAFDADFVTGDNYCDASSITDIDFLKIDVEGAEHKVLKGFGKRLKSRKVHCVQFEYGAFSTQTRFLLADYYSMLAEGYWIGKIYPTYVAFGDYQWVMEDFRFANYLAISKLRTDLRRCVEG